MITIPFVMLVVGTVLFFSLRNVPLFIFGDPERFSNEIVSTLDASDAMTEYFRTNGKLVPDARGTEICQSILENRGIKVEYRRLSVHEFKITTSGEDSELGTYDDIILYFDVRKDPREYSISP